MKEKPSYYANIPASVRYSDLKPNAKLLYGEITALSGKLGYCFASNSYFADLYGVSKNTISSWVSDLKKAEFITVIIERNKQKQIIKRCIGITDKMDTPLHEKMKGNTTSINTTSNNITIRELKFINDVSLTDYNINLKEEFCQYWCERNKSNTQMKFEMQKTFDIGRRLSRWSKNEGKWDRPKQTMSKIDSQLNEYKKGKELL